MKKVRTAFAMTLFSAFSLMAIGQGNEPSDPIEQDMEPIPDDEGGNGLQGREPEFYIVGNDICVHCTFLGGNCSGDDAVTSCMSIGDIVASD